MDLIGLGVIAAVLALLGISAAAVTHYKGRFIRRGRKS
jgi:hypothetical protein